VMLTARSTEPRGPLSQYALLSVPLLLAADLFSVGIGYNPTAKEAEVYPMTPLIARLQEIAGHDRIMPVNPGHFSFSGPNSILPPNGAMVFGLRDVQGYDSLFPGQYKAFMDEIAAPVDPQFKSAPLQVGNMVLAKNPDSPLAPLTGARYIVSRDTLPLPNGSYVEGLYVYELPGAVGRARADRAAIRWVRDEATRVEIEINASAPTSLTLADEDYPGWVASVDGRPVEIQRADRIFRRVAVPAGSHRVTFEFRPAAFRIGLYLALAVLATCAACLIGSRRARPLGGA
jgi:hypothetical protein